MPIVAILNAKLYFVLSSARTILKSLCAKDPLYVLTEDEKATIWKYRHHLQRDPMHLSRVLQSGTLPCSATVVIMVSLHVPEDYAEIIPPTHTHTLPSFLQALVTPGSRDGRTEGTRRDRESGESWQRYNTHVFLLFCVVYFSNSGCYSSQRSRAGMLTEKRDHLDWFFTYWSSSAAFVYFRNISQRLESTLPALYEPSVLVLFAPCSFLRCQQIISRFRWGHFPTNLKSELLQTTNYFALCVLIAAFDLIKFCLHLQWTGCRKSTFTKPIAFWLSGRNRRNRSPRWRCLALSSTITRYILSTQKGEGCDRQLFCWERVGKEEEFCASDLFRLAWSWLPAKNELFEWETLREVLKETQLWHSRCKTNTVGVLCFSPLALAVTY